MIEVRFQKRASPLGGGVAGDIEVLVEGFPPHRVAWMWPWFATDSWEIVGYGFSVDQNNNLGIARAMVPKDQLVQDPIQAIRWGLWYVREQLGLPHPESEEIEIR